MNEIVIISSKYNLALEVIGSFATGLWTPSSDIDLALINNLHVRVDILALLKAIYTFLKARKVKLEIQELHLNEESKFPNIKCYLCNGRMIDISIYQQKCMARRYVQFIQH